MMIYNNNNIPIYTCNVEGERTRRTTRTVIGRRRTSPPLLCVCVCNNYDQHGGNPDAVAAAKESSQSRSRFDFGSRATDRFSTIYLFIFFFPPHTVVHIHVTVVLGPMKICSLLKIWYIITSTVHHRVFKPINNNYIDIPRTQ